MASPPPPRLKYAHDTTHKRVHDAGYKYNGSGWVGVRERPHAARSPRIAGRSRPEPTKGAHRPQRMRVTRANERRTLCDATRLLSPGSGTPFRDRARKELCRHLEWRKWGEAATMASPNSTINIQPARAEAEHRGRRSRKAAEPPKPIVSHLSFKRGRC